MADKFDPKRNLIVNYIPNSLTQEDVQKMFERIGTVSSCKLIINKLTGTSQGYAFVEYAEEDSAQRAIDEITGTQILGKTIKVSLAVKPDNENTEAKNANVYIAGLPPTMADNALLSHFTPFGSVLSHKLLIHPDGTSRGAGFVRYSLKTEADEAIREMNGKILSGSTVPLTVKMAIPPSKQDTQSLKVITNNTLNGIGVASRTANVRYNPMLPSNSMLVGNFGKPSTPTSAVAAAMSGLNSHIAQNGGGMTANQVPQPASVYVFGLQPLHSELTLYELFSPFGGILNVKLIRDLTKEEKPCKGYGFVNFTNMNDAVRAVTSMNGVQFEDKVLQVSFKQNKNQAQIHAQLPQSYGIMGMPGMGGNQYTITT